MSRPPSTPAGLREGMRARQGLLSVGAGAVLWGTTGIGVHIVHQRVGLAAVSIGCWRLAIAALALAAGLRWSGLRRARATLGRHRWRVVSAGVGLGVYQALYFIGVQNVGVSISTLVSLAVAPVAITVAEAIRRRRVPGVTALLTLSCAVAGLILISVAPDSVTTAPHPVIGVLASLGSGLGYAATTLLNARLSAQGDPLVLTGLASAIGALALLPVALPLGLAVARDGVSWGWLVYIGIVPTAIAYGLYYAGLRTTSSEAAGVVSLLEPLVAAALAAVVLHESLGGLGLAGSMLLLAAIGALYIRPPATEQPAAGTVLLPPGEPL